MKRHREWVIAQRSGPALHLKRWSDLGPGEGFQESTFRAASGIMVALSHSESTAREIYADLTGFSAHRTQQLDEDAWEVVRRAVERGHYGVASGHPRPSPATNVHLFTGSPLERNTHHYPVTLTEILTVTRSKWPEIRDTGARTLAAQWAHETKDGTLCWNYNIGNFKADPSMDVHMYLRGVWEVLARGDVQRAIQKGGGHARLATEDESRAKGWGHKAEQAVVVFDPPHPAASFLAFDSLAEGVQYWTDKHKAYGRKHPEHVPAIIAGDTATVAHVLKLEGYYTGNEFDYARNMKAKKAELDKLLGPP